MSEARGARGGSAAAPELTLRGLRARGGGFGLWTWLLRRGRMTWLRVVGAPLLGASCVWDPNSRSAVVVLQVR